MSRSIPEEIIEKIKKEISLKEMVEAFGVKLKGSGDNLLGHCPFHDDKTPSLVVTPSKNLWNCLGACSMGGSVIDWVMKAQGMSFIRAVESLRDGFSFLDASLKPGSVIRTTQKAQIIMGRRNQ